MACVEERSKKGKMGEGRETTDTKTTGAGVHVGSMFPPPLPLYFQFPLFFFLTFLPLQPFFYWEVLSDVA